jgi:hypothetical protein
MKPTPVYGPPLKPWEKAVTHTFITEVDPPFTVVIAEEAPHPIQIGAHTKSAKEWAALADGFSETVIARDAFKDDSVKLQHDLDEADALNRELSRQVLRVGLERNRSMEYAEKHGRLLLRCLREIPPQHIPADLYTEAGALFTDCGACKGSGEGPVVTYGGGPNGDGEMPTDCPKCAGSGSVLGVGNAEPLPCKVYCEAGPAFGAGIPISTLLGYFKRREKYNADNPLNHTCGLPEREWSREGPSKDCPLCKARADFRDLRGLIERASSDTPEPDTEDRITRDRRDAERYRFLREGRPGVYNNVMCWALDRLDAEVDAAMGNPTKSVPSQSSHCAACPDPQACWRDGCEIGKECGNVEGGDK